MAQQDVFVMDVGNRQPYHVLHAPSTDMCMLITVGPAG